MLKKIFSAALASITLLIGSEVFSQVNEVIYFWSGGLSADSAKVNAKLTSSTTSARLVVSTTSDLANPLLGPPTTANASSNYMAAMIVYGLSPSTKYYYAVQSNGVVDNSPDDIGTFTTPALGSQSFRFTVGSCNLNSNHIVFSKMAEKSPLFFLATGDFHYANPNSATNINIHRQPYENNMLSQTASRNFFKSFPLAYMWDDHDYCGDNTDSLAAGRMNARLAYQEYVPHYMLLAGAGNVPIYQSFRIGRIRFIMSDLRSMRGVGNAGSTSAALSMMGTVQKQWFKNECLQAKANNEIIAWVSTVSWGGDRNDNWGGFVAERRELADFFAANITNMFILSGDAHMAAIDNGSNHDFSTSGNPNSYPVLAAAAMNQGGSYKGGSYSEVGSTPPNGPNNTYLNPNNTFGQYGLVEVTDNGGSEVNIALTIFRTDNAGNETVLASYSFARMLNAIVPVNFLTFSLDKVSSYVCRLTWKADISSCDKFYVQRSSLGSEFSTIYNISCAGSGTQMFSYDDSLRSGTAYYRIKAIDQNGSVSYSPIRISQTVSSVMEATCYQHGQNLVIKLGASQTPTVATVSIFDSRSRLVKTMRHTFGSQQQPMMIPIQYLASGLYAVRVESATGIWNGRFTKVAR